LIIAPVLISRQGKILIIIFRWYWSFLRGWSYISLSARLCIQGRDPENVYIGHILFYIVETQDFASLQQHTITEPGYLGVPYFIGANTRFAPTKHRLRRPSYPSRKNHYWLLPTGL